MCPGQEAVISLQNYLIAGKPFIAQHEAQRLEDIDLNLAHPLPGQTNGLADLFQSSNVMATQTKPTANHVMRLFRRYC